MKKLLLGVLALACTLTLGGCTKIETPFTKHKPNGITLTQSLENKEFREPGKERKPPYPKPIPVPNPKPVQPK